MTHRIMMAGVGLSFLVMSITVVAGRQALKKHPLWRDVYVEEAKPDPAIPPGFWIEYNAGRQLYRDCHDSYGVRSCWLAFHTREEAIRDAQVFANYLQHIAKD